jgi:hypothetical protein
MKIKWTADDRIVPGVGRLNSGMVVSLSAELAAEFVRQGLAEKIEDSGLQIADFGLKQKSTNQKSKI